MAATHEVNIIKTPKGHFVVPGNVIVAVGDTIIWNNCTEGKIDVLLPGVFPGKLQKTAAGDPMVVVGIPLAAGFQPYAVYSSEANDFCIGQSTPGVIIKKGAVNAS